MENNMNINIKATNTELTLEIKEYLEQKIQSLERFFGGEQNLNIFVEIGKDSNHHQKGEDVFLAEIRFVFEGKDFYVKSRSGDVLSAIDFARDEVAREIKERKGKSQTLFVRGARSLKKRIKGMKPWWPFGDKN
jgi:ribosomal subunit interface protein